MKGDYVYLLVYNIMRMCAAFRLQLVSTVVWFEESNSI